MEDEYTRTESLAGLFRGVIDDTRELFREEVALARAEVREEIGKAATAAIQMSAAGVIGAVGIVFLLLALAHGMAVAFDWPVGAGYAAVAVLLAAGAAILYARGRHEARTVNPTLPKTSASIQENKEWLQARTR
jgi:Putative Actinobacterial Holin-X, holin superfamily III